MMLVAGMYQSGDWLMFGAETTGLPKEVTLPVLVASTVIVYTSKVNDNAMPLMHAR